MKIRLALIAAVALTIAAVMWRRTQTPRNVSLLLVTIDTLRSDHVGAYGSARGLTPSIDELAARGWTFEKAVSAVPLTLPSHSTILSGLDPLHHGVRNNGTFVFPTDRDTLATRLKSAGYATAAFVSAVVLDHRYGLSRGFDVYDDQIARAREGRSVLESERSCAEVSKLATRWIESQNGRFFAWVHIYEPHAPYAPPADMAALHPDPYDAEVATADRCLADLLAAAEAASHGEMITAVTSDHGEGLGEHGESTHGLFLYQSTLSVPMVIAGRGVPVGKRTHGLARSADLAPTLLGLLGLPPLTMIDGHDLAIGGDRTEAYAESDYAAGFGWSPLRSWRLGTMKLIDAPKPELYDLANDPGEETNLAEGRPNDVARLQTVLRAALTSEVKKDQRRVDAETEERLRSLGYVAAAPSAANGTPASGMDPKDALPIFQGFERAMTAEARGDLVSSVKELSAAVEKDPKNVTLQRSLASALRRTSRQDDAIQVLRKIEALAPRDAAIEHDLAAASAERGNVVQAIEFEKKALAIDPTFVEALDHLATLQATQGEYAAARTSIDRALALDSNDARAWSNRGNITRAQNQVPESERSFKEALRLMPDLAEALIGLGVLAVEQGRLDEAARLFETALAADPKLDEARLNLAVVEQQRGRTPRAIELARQTAQMTADVHLREKALAFLRALQSASR